MELIQFYSWLKKYGNFLLADLKHLTPCLKFKNGNKIMETSKLCL